MANHLWAILGTKAIVDLRSNNASITNIIEQINIETNIPEGKTGLIPLSTDLMLLTERSDYEVPESLKGRFVIISADGEELGDVKFDINLAKSVRTRNIIHTDAMPVKGAGRYVISIQHYDEESEAWKEKGQSPISISFTKGEQPANQ